MNILHSSQIPYEYLDALKDVLPEFKSIYLPVSDSVYPSIAAHPDIFFFEIERGRLVCSPSVDRAVSAALDKSGFNIIPAQVAPSGRYPGTAVLNAVRIGRYIFHNMNLTDEIIKGEAKDRGLELVHINQGYARCSVVPVGDEALITCDSGIAEAALRLGISVLTVSPGDIVLPREKYGFIGGACGVTGNGTIIFLGDITLHKDFSEIDAFIKRYGCDYIFLAGLKLFDAGSMFITSC